VNFLIDAQLPPALAKFLTDRGHNAEHVESLGLLKADDPAIWNYAATKGAVIVTKDEDFPDLAALRPGGPPVVWLRIGNCSNRALLSWLDPLLPTILHRLAAGDSVVEVV